jgi:hypothetical protein
MNRNISRQTGRGGARPGAGRPPGSKNQRSAEIARQAVEAGITPIELMLKAMRDLWDEGTSEAKREAAKIAKDAAPYVHRAWPASNKPSTSHSNASSTRQNPVSRPRSGKQTLELENTAPLPERQ